MPTATQEALEALLENDVIAYVLQIYDASKRDHCDVLHIYEKGSDGEPVLKKLAEATGGQMLEVRGIAKLESALDEISDELHHPYSLGYYPENKNWDGKFRKIQISAGERKLQSLCSQRLLRQAADGQCGHHARSQRMGSESHISIGPATIDVPG